MKKRIKKPAQKGLSYEKPLIKEEIIRINEFYNRRRDGDSIDYLMDSQILLTSTCCSICSCF
jgi:hypothetical protein